jgi:hypothetical protein
MNDQTPEQTTAPCRQTSCLFRWSILSLLFYVLSIGPALKLSGRNPPVSLFLFYAPLEQLDRHSNFVHETLSWYIHKLWQVP